MEHHKLFPTHLFVFDDFLDDFEEISPIMKGSISAPFIKLLQHYQDNQKEDFNLQERSYNDSWQTKPDLHTMTEFKPLRDKVIKVNKEILNILNYDVKDIKISSMWATVLRPGESHPAHTHSNNFLAGVFYLHSDESANIMFNDPRSVANVILPKAKKHSKENSTVEFYDSKPNRAVIFPAWLNHSVPVNKSTDNRISIAWNIQVKGEMEEYYY